MNAQEVIINGISIHECMDDRITIWHDFSPFGVNNAFFSHREQARSFFIPKKNGIFKQKLPVESYQVGRIDGMQNVSEGWHSKPQWIFMTPGDSVFFVADSMYLKGWDSEKTRFIIFRFSGENAAHYNWSYKLDSVLGSGVRPSFRRGDNPFDYRILLTERRDKSLRFLEAYRQRYNVSDQFYNFAKASIKNEFIWNLFWPVRSGLIERSEVCPSYFIGNFLTPVINNHLSAWGYHAVMGRYFFGTLDEPWERMDSLFNYFIHNYDEQERAYLVSVLIGMLAQRQQNSCREQFFRIVEDALTFVENPRYLQYIDRAVTFFAMGNNPFPEDVLSKTRLKEYKSGEIFTLEEVLKKYKDRPIYIAFWASWCGPCLINMENSQQAKAFLKERGVKFIYISTDTREEAWRNTSQRKGVTQNQYLLLDSRTSPLTNHVRITNIPRYILLNAEHIIVDGNAPPPIPAHFNSLRNSINRLFMRTVTF